MIQTSATNQYSVRFKDTTNILLELEAQDIEMAEAIEKSLNALTIKIDNFDGSDSCDPEQFVDSLNRYLETTGKTSPDFVTNW